MKKLEAFAKPKGFVKLRSNLKMYKFVTVTKTLN